VSGTTKEEAVLLLLHSIMFLCLRQVKIPPIFSRDSLQPQDISHLPAVKWEIEKEEIARSAYVAKVSVLHQGFECQSSGLVVNCRYPHLGASPDGLVSCDCCFGKGIVEIKCPFSCKDKKFDERAQERSFFIEEDSNGHLVLKKGTCLLLSSAAANQAE